MIEIPMLFSIPMVQAILAGRKSQTRRIVKADLDDRGLRYCNQHTGWEDWHGKGIKCPYGKPGDLIWVKETHYAYGWWVKEGKKWRFVDFTREEKGGKYHYIDNTPAVISKRTDQVFGWFKRSSLFMPKAAARIWLKVTNIRVERLQDISNEDAINEGLEIANTGERGPILYKDYLLKKAYFGGQEKAFLSFKSLWEKINGPGSWEANPWLWVVTFEVISTTGKPDSI